MDTIVLTVGDETYRFRWDEITASVSRRVRAATGMSLFETLNLLEGDIDIDVVAAVVFAAALQAGDTVTLAEIEGKIGYQTEIEVEFVAGGDPEV